MGREDEKTKLAKLYRAITNVALHPLTTFHTSEIKPWKCPPPKVHENNLQTAVDHALGPAVPMEMRWCLWGSPVTCWAGRWRVLQPLHGWFGWGPYRITSDTHSMADISLSATL